MPPRSGGPLFPYSPYAKAIFYKEQKNWHAGRKFCSTWENSRLHGPPRLQLHSLRRK